MNSAEEFAVGAGVIHSPSVALGRKKIAAAEFRTDEARANPVTVTASAILGVCQAGEKVFGRIVGLSLQGRRFCGSADCSKGQQGDEGDFFHCVIAPPGQEGWR